MKIGKSQKIVRYKQDNGDIYYGIAKIDEIIQLTSSFIEITNNELKYDGLIHKYEDVNILEPVVPSKIINFGWTYTDHAEETGGKPGLKEPFLFLKPLSSLIPNKGEIILPPKEISKQIEMEGEVAIVIGKRCKNVTEDTALDYVFGCTVFNDVTARDLTQSDPQFTRGKGFDTFGPLGPCIVRGLDPTNLNIVTTLNNRVVQTGNTNQMSLSIPFLISWISNVMTLEPGDVLATGSPGGSCSLNSGDTVIVAVDGIGSLCNFVK